MYFVMCTMWIQEGKRMRVKVIFYSLATKKRNRSSDTKQNYISEGNRKLHFLECKLRRKT
jgi:hypothetical protein